jgi:hypothetical protein
MSAFERACFVLAFTSAIILVVAGITLFMH